MSAVDIILGAINKRRILAFTYKGEERTAEPYILGYDDKGALVLSAVQLTGGSGAGFRTFHLDGLSGLHLAERKFHRNHPDYNPRDPYFARVLGKI
jgi:hypothetical protein